MLEGVYDHDEDDMELQKNIISVFAKPVSANDPAPRNTASSTSVPAEVSEVVATSEVTASVEKETPKDRLHFHNITYL